MKAPVPSLTVNSPTQDPALTNASSVIQSQSEQGLPPQFPTRYPDLHSAPEYLAFLSWPNVDEFGETNTSPADKRVERYLETIYSSVPGIRVGELAGSRNRTTRAKQAAAQRTRDKALVEVAGKNVAQVEDQLQADGQSPRTGRTPPPFEVFRKFKDIWLQFVPASYSATSAPAEFYWGAVFFIVTVSVIHEPSLLETN